MLTFEPKEHVYKWNGDIKPSVTTILNEWVKVRDGDYHSYAHTSKKNKDGTAVSVPAHIFEAAGNHGTGAHLISKYMILGQGVIKEGLHPDYLPFIDEIEKFKLLIKETILCEVPLYSKKFEFAGTPDWFGYLKGWKYPVIVDLKTGQYELVAVQLSAYEQLIREYKSKRHPKGYKGIINHLCLSIPKSGGSSLFEVTDRQAFKEFRNRHEVFKRNAGRVA